MLYLEDEDHINAEVYLKKAASLIGNSEDDEIQLQYKVRFYQMASGWDLDLGLCL